MAISDRTRLLHKEIRRLYSHANGLPYHGMLHVLFVTKKALEFADPLGADLELVEAAALTHDLNYFVSRTSRAEAGQEMRSACLAKARFGSAEIARIEMIVVTASSKHRVDRPSAECQALADADMLFKALPVTPIIFAREYLEEGGRSLLEMAHEIVEGQRRLLAEGQYFYSTEARRRYLGWAETNVRLWENVIEALDDVDVAQLVEE